MNVDIGPFRAAERADVDSVLRAAMGGENLAERTRRAVVVVDDSLILVARNSAEQAEQGVLGVIAASMRPDAVEIVGIAVAPSARARGIGGALVDALASSSATECGRRPLTAETDADAVGFYRTIGFAVTSLGELYPGVERFLCQRST